MDILITATDAVLHLGAGDVLTIPLPEDLTDEQIDALVNNVRMGAFANHLDVKIGKEGDVQLVTKYECGCFGVDLKKGVAALAFEAPGSTAEKLKLGDYIRTMAHANRFSVVLATTPVAPVVPAPLAP